MNKYQVITDWSHKMRIQCIEHTYKAGRKGGHMGGALSSIEIFAALYSSVANINLENRYDENRDRIIVSKGHCVLSYFAA